ncbi:adenine phosphoribosyltransferase [Gemmatimonas sp.]|uniref:adenine phosphoribosyltransferase n=1 Tax=Gemmatimonas sp. TaxID=1962908 RepID=UPI00333F1BB0
MTSPDLETRLRRALRDVPDFPTPGILFKDITPVLADPVLLREVIAALVAPHVGVGITHVVAVESRGFLFGVPMALELNVAFAPARKPGKLPWRTIRESYALEYGHNELELHEDALRLSPERDTPARVLVVDDVLATGGTAAATCRLVQRLGGEVVGVAVPVELGFLNGRQQLGGCPVTTLLTF